MVNTRARVERTAGPSSPRILVPYLTAREERRARPRPAGRHERAGSACPLSAGERQRVAIARALASAVGVLLVDEPTARLDEENGRAIAELLAAAARERGRAVVCATHDPVLVELADEVVELDRHAQL